jgi:Flp pilus assembly protein TadG
MIRRLHDDESGVTAIIIALSMLLFMGLIALSIDGGGLLLRRREMVNGSDAAALAAAQSCASRTASDEERQADDLARMNIPTITTAETAGPNISEATNCHTGSPGHVSVSYTSTQSLFFAPAIGFQRTSAVSAQATATWGPAGSAPAIPLVLNITSTQSSCDGGDIPDVPPGTRCVFWFDNGNFGGPNFGFADFSATGWDQPQGSANCNSSNDKQSLQGNLQGPGISGLTLNYPLATYVCAFGGDMSGPDWSSVEPYLIGQTRDFPVNWIGPESPSPGIAPPQGEYVQSNKIFQFDIIGWTRLTVQDIYGQGVNPDMSQCGTPPPGVGGGNARCLVAVWNGSTLGGQDLGHGANFGIQGVALCDLRYANGCFG